MAVSTTDTYSGPYVANGVTVEFPFTFKAVSPQEVRVSIVRDGVGETVDPTAFTVALLESGGTVLFSSAPISGDVYIASDPLFIQQVAFASGQAYRPETVNEVNDRAAVRDLYLKGETDRAAKLPITGGREGDVPTVSADGRSFELISGETAASRYLSWKWSEDTTPVVEGQTVFPIPGIGDARIRVVRNTAELPEVEGWTVDRTAEQVVMAGGAHLLDLVFIETIGNGSTLLRALAQHVTASDPTGDPSDVQTELGRRALGNLSNVPGIEQVQPNFEGSGYSALVHGISFIYKLVVAAAFDVRDRFFLRRADYVGGDGGSAEHGGAGFVNANSHFQTDVGEGARSNEWVGLFQLNNRAPGLGPGALAQNAALYALGKKLVRSDGAPTSPTIVGVVELEDFTKNPISSSVSLEIDSSVQGPNNTDDNNARALLHLAPRSRTGTGGGNEAAYGIFCTPTTGMHVKTMFKTLLDGGTIGTYLDFPNVLLTSAGDFTCHQLRAQRSAGDSMTGARMSIVVDGAERLRAYCDNSANAIFDNGAGIGFRINPSANALEPLTDGVMKFGGGSNRIAEIFAANPVINTSDGTKKTALRVMTDAELDAIGDVQLGIYQWLDAVAEKGEDGARLHVGAIAQQLRDAFAARGLDVSRYAFWCADPETEIVMEDQSAMEPEKIMAPTFLIEHEFVEGKAMRRKVPFQEERDAPPDMVPEYDETGAPVMLAATAAKYGPKLKDGKPVGSLNPKHYEIVLIREALPERPSLIAKPRMCEVKRKVPVERPVMDSETGQPKLLLGLRYPELLVAMQAWTRRELARLATRVAALEEAA